MEIADILKISYEFFRVKEDRMVMGFEDDRARLLRSLDKVNQKYTKMITRFTALSKDYKDLQDDVTKSLSSRASTADSDMGDAALESNKTISNSSSRTPVTKVIETAAPTAKLSPQKRIITEIISPTKPNAKKRKIMSENRSRSTNDAAFLTTKSLSTTDSADDWLENKSPQKNEFLTNSTKTTSGKAKAVKPPTGETHHNPLNFESKAVPVAEDKTVSSGNRFLKKHQSCVEIPPNPNNNASSSSSSNSNTMITSNSAMRQSIPQQLQLQIAPKPSKVVHRSVSAHAGIAALTNRNTSSSSSSSGGGGGTGRYGGGAVVTSSSKPMITSNNRSISLGSGGRNHNMLTDNYKCIDVVRNKESRDALPGHTCFECEKFYEAMVQQGVFSPDSKKARLQECSRHKSKWTPPTTPEGFWDLTVHTPEEWKSK